MFRLPPRKLHSKVILQCKLPLQSQICCISRVPPLQDRYDEFRERERCPEPPPCPPPPPKKRPWLWQLLGVAAATAAFTVYAHETPKVRDWLSMNAPWFDDWIAFAYQENTPFPQAFIDLMCDNPVASYLEKWRKKEKQMECIKPELVSQSCLPKQKDKPIGPQTKEEVAAEKAKEVEKKAEEIKKMKETGEFKEKNKDEVCEQYDPKGGKKGKKEKEDEEKPKKEAKKEDKVEHRKPPTKEELAEMSRCVGELTQCIKCNVGFAKEACKDFNKAAERAFVDYNTKEFNKLECKIDKRKYLVRQHLEKLEDPRTKLKDTVEYMECAVKDPKMKKELQEVLRQSKKIIAKADAEFEKERFKSKELIRKYYLVKPFMEKLIEENKMFVRGLDYEESPVYYFDGDLDLLLQHCQGYKRLLKEQLAIDRKHMAKRADKAFNALECTDKARKGNMYKVDATLAARRADITKDINKRYEIQHKENEEALQKALKKQRDKFEAQTDKMLKDKEAESAEKLKKMVSDKVEAERASMRVQLDDMKKQLKKVEDKLNAKLKAEEEAVKAQSLYAAGSSLLNATKSGTTKRVCVTKELKAIERSGKGDELVTAVLKSIPEEVHKYGIVPEKALRHKFEKVEGVARKVALVEREGSPLPVYLASWVQSLMLWKRMDVVPVEEMNRPPNQPVCVKGMDTFDILARARYWMERGNLARALEYVEKLEGASRSAAERWYRAARAHLETRQAAHAVIAHAANLNLRNI